MTRTICPVCNGRGKIKNPKISEYEIPYNKDIECPNCQGEGFIGVPDNISIKKKFYSKK